MALHPLADKALSGLSEHLAEKTGIFFPRERWRDMERAVGTAAAELGFNDVNSFITSFMSAELARTELEILASHITVGETYFFREPKNFDVVEHQILSNLIRDRRGKDQSLRIWSAGCATGEEPYSIAMLLHKLLPDIAEWNINLLATDINPRFLRKAETGLYSEWSFRGVPGWIKDKYFKAGSRGYFQIVPEIKRMVNFTYLNLADDLYPSLANGTNAMDLIFCRNVLMYFKPARMRQVIENLRHCLVDRGWLTVSSVEASHVMFSAYVPVTVHGYTFYRRVDGIPGKNTSIAKSAGTDTRLSGGTAGPVSRDAEDEFPLPGAADISVTEPEAPAEAVTTRTSSSPYEEAHTLFLSGSNDKAIDRIGSILAIDPDNIPAIELMARILANQGDLAQACEWCSRAISIDRLNAGCHYLYAIILQERGLIGDAVAALKRALYLEPGMVLAHFSLGNLARAEGRDKDSSRYFENTIVLLDKYQPEAILPESDGMTVKRLRQIIETLMFQARVA